MLLAIDSSTRVLSLALHDGQRLRAESTWHTANQHTVELMPAIERLLSQTALSTVDLTLLAVAQGPGSFNGLRIGFSVAKGLALALVLPLIAIPTLDIIATAQPPFEGILIAVAEAGRGRVCAGHYRWNGSRWISQDDVQIIGWNELVSACSGPTLVSGEIDAAARAAIAQSRQPIQVAQAAFALRRAGFLADLAWQRWREAERSEQGLMNEPAVPFYLHQPGVPHP